MAPVERVIKLARAATSKIDETYDAPDVLSFTTEALEVIKAHPDLQAGFESAFLDMSVRHDRVCGGLHARPSMAECEARI